MRRDEAIDFVATAVERIDAELPGVDTEAMRMVLLLHRVTNSLVYDLESTVHRPAGWSWAAFRLMFTLWMAGPLESSRAAETSGMSRQAVSALSNTLVAEGVLQRSPSPDDGRTVVLSMTDDGRSRLADSFLRHNEREARWASAFSPEELSTLLSLLDKLAGVGQQPWVSHRF